MPDPDRVLQCVLLHRLEVGKSASLDPYMHVVSPTGDGHYIAASYYDIDPDAEYTIDPRIDPPKPIAEAAKRFHLE